MIEKIVCTKEQAERLRKAGWTKETAFCWCNGIMYQGEIFAGGTWHVWETDEDELFTMRREDGVTILPAPTIGELIEATGCISLSFFKDNEGEKHYQAGDGDLYVLGTSYMESLVRLFEAQSKREEVG